MQKQQATILHLELPDLGAAGQPKLDPSFWQNSQAKMQLLLDGQTGQRLLWSPVFLSLGIGGYFSLEF